MAVDQRSALSRGSRSASMPAAAGSTTYGSIRETPAIPSHFSLPVSAHAAASSAGHGVAGVNPALVRRPDGIGTCGGYRHGVVSLSVLTITSRGGDFVHEM
jgi:hypothetical protein